MKKSYLNIILVIIVVLFPCIIGSKVLNPKKIIYAVNSGIFTSQKSS